MELVWSNPPFDGRSATSYRVFMRNLTRNFAHWNAIPYRGSLTKNTLIVRNLPSGVRCQFRVQGYSQGGWSAYSEASVYVCPGDAFKPLDFHAKWSKISLGGPLAVVDRLRAYPFVREDWIKGMHLLLVFGQKEDGFHKGKIQLEVASEGLKALETYREDPQVIPVALKVLGYSLRGTHFEAVEREMLAQGLSTQGERCLTHFRHNTDVVGALVFLQSCLSPGITVIPPAEHSN